MFPFGTRARHMSRKLSALVNDEDEDDNDDEVEVEEQEEDENATTTHRDVDGASIRFH